MAILYLSQLLVISRLHLKQLLAFLLLKEFDLQGLLLEDKMIGGNCSSSISHFHSTQKTRVHGMR